MQGIFIDDALEKEFQREGFIKVPFLDEVGLRLFRKNVASIMPHFYDSTWGICSATDLNQPELVRNVHLFVCENIAPYISPYFQNFQIILGNYLIKKPQDNTLIPIHQDWTFVDEQQYYSLSIWCPLDDVNPKNGNLQVVPRTHRMSANLRPSPSYPNAFEEVMDLARENLKDIPMKAGEAIFYDHALLHASPINASGMERSALILGLTHSNAILQHYYLSEQSKANQSELLEQYLMDKDFFVNHIRGEKPPLTTMIREVITSFQKVNRDKFLSALKARAYA
jgi:hypothetical protein